MMDLYEVIRKRRSIRKYSNKPISDEVLSRLGEAVNLAPSACNLQPWRIEVIVNEALRQKICQVYKAPWLSDAPAIAVALGNPMGCWQRLEGTPIVEIDIGIVMEHLILAATAEGLGSCWVCAFDKKAMGKALQIEAPWQVEAIAPLGYAEMGPAELKRKNLSEVYKVIK